MSDASIHRRATRSPGGARLPARSAELGWRLIRDAPGAGARNMALDHALAACLGRGEGVLRLYGWRGLTISFGRNEATAGHYSPSATATAGIEFVRRPTGGRAVAHRRELTYAVVVPPDTWGGPREAYVAINRALAAALGSIGAVVEVAGAEWAGQPASAVGSKGPRSRALGPDAGPCFRSPAVGEVTAGGRKLVGSAQVRLEGALLQHGSILVEDDQAIVEGLARRENGTTLWGQPMPRVASEARPATMRELVGDVSIDELTEAVAMSLRTEFRGSWTSGGYRRAEVEAADRLETGRYACDSWTWRR